MKETMFVRECKVNKRDIFDENKILTYKLACDEGFTYKEFIEALHKLDYDENYVEEVIGEPTKIAPYKLKDGREIEYILEQIKRDSNDRRWIIEWYEGVWFGDELPMLRKKGFVHREVFLDECQYTDRLNKLESDNDNSPIIVGTYECKIVNRQPERSDTL